MTNEEAIKLMSRKQFAKYVLMCPADNCQFCWKYDKETGTCMSSLDSKSTNQSIVEKWLTKKTILEIKLKGEKAS